ncbi:hypothetical protein ACIQVR_38255 [Streptomyces xanthochromogenes]|uniref:hypothetical protein n=1 Tax=Streptomyces xanthochromogenes TaxID=67384 RepID=UPI00381E8438
MPVATGTATFNAAYRRARAARTVSIGIERRGRSWAVRADALLAAPGLAIDAAQLQSIWSAAHRLIRAGVIHRSSGLGCDHFTLNGVREEEQARLLAAALHAALYGDLAPLDRLVEAGARGVGQGAVDTCG